MEMTKTLVAVPAGLAEMDTVRIDDAWWLVCSWKDAFRRHPKRLVRLSGLAHEEVKGQSYRFVLSRPLPLELVEDERVPGFLVRELC
jgi:hypothetical protein